MNNIIKALGTIVGPAAVIAAGTMGAGAVASFILAGAWFRYDLLWVILIMLPIFVVSVDTSSRIGTLTPEEGMFSLIRRQINPGIAWLLLLINIPVHVLIMMGQVSVMTSALLSTFGFYPPQTVTPTSYSENYGVAEVVVGLVCAAAILWLVLSHGYQRMQRAMTALMVLMFFCFLIVAFRGFIELPDILAGFIPSFPPDLPQPDGEAPRIATSSIIAMAGAALAPAALLGMPYLSEDARQSANDLRANFKKSVINLGVIFGAYAMFVVIAGGYALYPLANNAQIETVHEAGRVLHKAFPGPLEATGSIIFSLGVFTASITTLIVAAQVSAYFCLDMVRKSWHFTADNKLYHVLLAVLIMGSAILAPFWSFPALLKVVLLMGINVVVIPLVFVVIIYLVNSKSVVKEHTAEWWRNALLLLGLALSIALAIHKVPHYIETLLA